MPLNIISLAGDFSKLILNEERRESFFVSDARIFNAKMRSARKKNPILKYKLIMKHC